MRDATETGTPIDPALAASDDTKQSKAFVEKAIRLDVPGHVADVDKTMKSIIKPTTKGNKPL